MAQNPSTDNPTPSSDDVHELNEVARQSVTYMNIGLQIAVSFALFAMLGYWLDQHFQKSPLFTLLGVGFALLGMGYQLRNMLRKMDAQDKNRPKRRYNSDAFKDVDEAQTEAEKEKWGN